MSHQRLTQSTSFAHLPSIASCFCQHCAARLLSICSFPSVWEASTFLLGPFPFIHHFLSPAHARRQSASANASRAEWCLVCRGLQFGAVWVRCEVDGLPWVPGQTALPRSWSWHVWLPRQLACLVPPSVGTGELMSICAMECLGVAFI